jgi:RND family efflux transporter MFP subunit
VAAYVSTVLVRPGATVRRNDVLATLDCRNASATSRAIALQARALQARQEALAHQVARVSGLVDGGFIAPNEVEQREAESESEAARLAATRAQLMGSTLAVNDCVLRAPFDGEVASRAMDPGAFVRPGASIATLVDRSTVRVVADVPESDYTAVAPGTSVRLHLLATGRDIVAAIARRSPSADAATRTIHIEIDLADAHREFPVGTTAELSIDVGDPVAAIEIPATAASLRGDRATLFSIENGVARRVRATLIGERGGSVFIDASVAPGASIVTEGRGLLNDGDRVTTQPDPPSRDASPRLAQPPTTAAAVAGGRS